MKYSKFFKENTIEISLFMFFFIYFFIWTKFNYENIEFNNNELGYAISLNNFNPYVSYFLLKISEFLNLKLFFGYILFPSLVGVILYKIFNKLSGSILWAISLTLLSIISTENFPFIKFLNYLLVFDNTYTSFNIYENFEIQGFPLPSFSIFYFSYLFYSFFTTIKFKNNKLYIITTLWFIGPLIHPFDGIIGIVFWNFIILFFWQLKKININKVFFFYLISLNLLIAFFIFSQINIINQIVSEKQNYSIYNFIVYFVVPLLLVIICIKYFKVDFREFYQKFLGIYILYFFELLIIFLSIIGVGLDLRMTQTRIFMFLIHFLYYVPVIYYLNRDSYFIMENKRTNNIKNIHKNILFFIFCKFNKFYLPAFSFLIIVYLIGSINI